MDDDWRSRLHDNITEVTSLFVVAVTFALMFGVGTGWGFAAFLVGFTVLIPLVALLFGDEEDVREWWGTDEATETDETIDDQPSEITDGNRDALETLRERYATGELTDEQYERKLETLLETETLEDVAERHRERSRDLERDR